MFDSSLSAPGLATGVSPARPLAALEAVLAASFIVYLGLTIEEVVARYLGWESLVGYRFDAVSAALLLPIALLGAALACDRLYHPAARAAADVLPDSLRAAVGWLADAGVAVVLFALFDGAVAELGSWRVPTAAEFRDPESWPRIAGPLTLALGLGLILLAQLWRDRAPQALARAAAALAAAAALVAFVPLAAVADIAYYVGAATLAVQVLAGTPVAFIFLTGAATLSVGADVLPSRWLNHLAAVMNADSFGALALFGLSSLLLWRALAPALNADARGSSGRRFGFAYLVARTLSGLGGGGVLPWASVRRAVAGVEALAEDERVRTAAWVLAAESAVLALPPSGALIIAADVAGVASLSVFYAAAIPGTLLIVGSALLGSLAAAGVTGDRRWAPSGLVWLLAAGAVVAGAIGGLWPERELADQALALVPLLFMFAVFLLIRDRFGASLAGLGRWLGIAFVALGVLSFIVWSVGDLALLGDLQPETLTSVVPLALIVAVAAFLLWQRRKRGAGPATTVSLRWGRLAVGTAAGLTLIALGLPAYQAYIEAQRTGVAFEQAGGLGFLAMGVAVLIGAFFWARQREGEAAATASAGFDFPTLAVIVATLGVLAAIAVPAYIDYARRAGGDPALAPEHMAVPGAIAVVVVVLLALAWGRWRRARATAPALGGSSGWRGPSAIRAATTTTVIGILAAIAVPAYNDYSRRAGSDTVDEGTIVVGIVAATVAVFAVLRWLGRRRGAAAEGAGPATVGGAPWLVALGLPAGVGAMLVGGLATPSEAGAIAAIAALFLAPRRGGSESQGRYALIAEAAIAVGAVLFLATAAMALTAAIEAADWRTAALAAAPDLSDASLLLIGAGTAAIAAVLIGALGGLILAVVALVPIGVTLGFDPLSTVVVFALASTLGATAPFVGAGFRAIAADFAVPPAAVAAALVPFLIVHAAVLAAVIAIPQLALWLRAALSN